MLRNALSTVIAILMTLTLTLLGAEPLYARNAKAAVPDVAGLQKYTSAELLQEGVRCIETDSLHDRAAACFSTIVNRYYANPDDKTKRQITAVALRHLANLYMSYDIDYRKAYHHLMTARQIAEEDGDDHNLAFIYMSLINLYHINDTPEKSLQKHVDGFLEKGMRVAIKGHNDTAITCLLIDMGMFLPDNKGWGRYAPLAKEVKSYNFNPDSPYSGISISLLRGFDALFNRQWDAAEKAFMQSCANVESLRYGERLLFSIKGFLMRVYHESGQIAKEEALARELLEIASAGDFKDYEIRMCRTLADIYASQGETDSAELYHDRFLHLQEELKKSGGFESVESMTFLSELDKVNKEVEMLSIKRQKQERVTVIILAALIVLIVVLAALLWVYTHLKRTHRNLYQRHEESMRLEEHHKLMREQWEEEKASLLARLQAAGEASSAAPESRQQTPGTEQASAEASKEVCEGDADEKQRLTPLYLRILKVLEESDDIFHSGYSLADLSSALDSQPRIVSRAINICHGSNFHQILGEYRIREASRRMHDPESENLTIESIAESVGFKSRTYFTGLFKKTIGLTPSEYWKMALRSKSSD